MNPFKDKRRLRQIAHHLTPVVTVADKGLSEPLIEETTRALHDHELIKVKLNIGDRDDREQIGTELAAATSAEIVQRIGKTLVLFKANPDAKPKLSNLSRHGLR